MQNQQSIRYEERLIAFLDILGFGEIIRKSANNAGAVATIHKLLHDAANHASLPRDYKFKHLKIDINKYITWNFSDTVTISCPFESFDYLNFIVGWVEIFQHLMWERHSAFLRGSIVYGKLYDSKEMIFGPALVKAYKLEKKKAIWPRVIIHKSVIKQLSPDTIKKSLCENFREDDKGLFYVDYLRDLFHIYHVRKSELAFKKRGGNTDIIIESPDPIEFLRGHKIKVEMELANYGNSKSKNRRKLAKYQSLAKYHNLVIDLFSTTLLNLINNTDLLREIFTDTMLGGLISEYKLKHKLENSSHAYLMQLISNYKPKYTAENSEYSDLLPLLGIAMDIVFDKYNETAPDDANEIIELFCKETPGHINNLFTVINGLKINLSNSLSN
jgi:hypothetical protein